MKAKNFKNEKRVSLISICMCTVMILIFLYMTIFLFDAYNILRDTVRASAYITLNEGSTVQEIDNFELDGSTLTIDDKGYKDIQVSFFSGQVTPSDKVYFSETDSILFKVLPKSAGKSFILSSGYILIIVLIIMITIMMNTGNIGIQVSEDKISKVLARALVVICIISLVLGVCVYGFLTLYGN